MSILKDQHAIVTGGSRGIGAAIAAALAGAGANVTVVGRDADALAAVAGSLGGQGHAEVADVGDAAGIAASFARARERFGPVRILVNNAGQVETMPVARMPRPTSWSMLMDEGIDVNDCNAGTCTVSKENTDQSLATSLYYGLYTDTAKLQEVSHPRDRDMRDRLKINDGDIFFIPERQPFTGGTEDCR